MRTSTSFQKILNNGSMRFSHANKMIKKCHYYFSNNMERELLLYNYKENKINSVEKWVKFVINNKKPLFRYKNYYAPDRPSMGKIQNYVTNKIPRDREVSILLQQSYKCETHINNGSRCLISLVYMLYCR